MFFFFSTREKARVYGSKVGKTLKDMGADSQKGKRWAICVKKEQPQA